MILLQLTVFGYLHTGKTSLINKIMNNDIFNNYEHTEVPMVYYKVHRDKNRKFCVEIEDTSVDVDINPFMNMLRKEITTNNSSMKNPVFSFFEKPMIPFSREDPYNSISYGRMAYFLVFDLTNASTLEYVKTVYLSMSAVYERCYTLKPFISLVGNKSDLVSEDSELVRQAENFALDLNRLRVNASEFTEDKETFFECLTYLKPPFERLTF
ncbi:GTPase, putative [Plasmodium ovale wallikeri]|uniref:GTPase, putative n=1 Tax=Plasmodium ovale wallikeri TaxID=864142 RepID=A0A1A8Z8X3_PLAOA|nr:GTPase, putative [Plasmodium ovale wallikeri]